MRTCLPLLFATLLLGSCGGDDDDSEAERRGVGAECAGNTDCQEEGQECLTQFSGGYCGVAACTADVDCPAGSACVTEDGALGNFCFLVCADKVECNDHRSLENESNCVSSLTFVDGAAGRKVCRPPLGS